MIENSSGVIHDMTWHDDSIGPPSIQSAKSCWVSEPNLETGSPLPVYCENAADLNDSASASTQCHGAADLQLRKLVPAVRQAMIARSARDAADCAESLNESWQCIA